jgi:cephalosporin-C deacetylase-like acetyl esterase
MSPVPVPTRDYRRETPASDEVFAVYKRMYQYDRTPLRASVDSADHRSEQWRLERVSFAAAYGNDRVPALLYLPKNTRPPYQTVVYFPGANAFRSSDPVSTTLELEADWFLPLVRSGRAVLFPVYKGAYERHVAGVLELPHVWRDAMIQSSKDIGRGLDYLETRRDIDAGRLGYFGVSMGGAVGPVMTAVEPRFKASILVGAGLYHWRRPPESEAINFLPRVKVPTLMINGRYDFFFSLKTSQGLMFDLLGTKPADKKHRVFESGHIPTERQEVIKEILDWLDRYLGPVGTR